MILRFNLVALFWASFILLLCLAPHSTLPEFNFIDLLSFDKLVHAGLFAVQVLLIMVGLKRQYSSYRLRYYAREIALTIGLLYGLLIEILQLTISTSRSFDWMDVVADALGCLLGLAFFRLIYGKEFV